MTILHDHFGDRLEVYYTRDAWLDRRRTSLSIGGSDVAAIMGVSRWASPWDIWRAKYEGIYPERSAEDQEVLDRGHRFEPVVLSEYEHHTGRGIIQPGGTGIVRHAELDWALGSCDAFAVDSGELGVVEAKTASRADGWGDHGTEVLEWGDGDEAKVPPAYGLQVYFYLACTGLPWADLAVLLPRYETRVLRIHRDENVQADILERVTSWRERHLVQGEPPEPDGSDAMRAWLTETFPGDPKKTVHPATAEQTSLISRLATVHVQKKKLEKAEAELKNRLGKSMGDQYKVLSDVGSAVYTLAGTRTTIDSEAIRSRHPDVAAECSKTTETKRSIRITPR